MAEGSVKIAQNDHIHVCVRRAAVSLFSPFWVPVLFVLRASGHFHVCAVLQALLSSPLPGPFSWCFHMPSSSGLVTTKKRVCLFSRTRWIPPGVEPQKCNQRPF